MTLTDPVANALTIIRNGVLGKKQEISFPYSKFKFNICSKLEKEGYLEKIETNNRNIIVHIKYYGKESKVGSIKKISTASRFVYLKYSQLHKSCPSGLFLISTSKGLLTQKEAFKAKQGGKVILHII